MIAFAEVPIGRGGELRCSRCGRGPADRSPAPVAHREIAEHLLRVAGSWTYGPGPNVRFVGFEPFAHPELPTVIGLAVNAGFERVRLRTDGGALGVSGNARGVLHAGVRQFEVVLLGPDAALHDAASARPGLFAAMDAGLGALRAAAEEEACEVLLSGFVPICAHNMEHLPSTIAALAERGAVAATIDLGGRSLGRRGGELVEAAIETATVNSMAIELLGAQLLGRQADAKLSSPWRVVCDA